MRTTVRKNILESLMGEERGRVVEMTVTLPDFPGSTFYWSETGVNKLTWDLKLLNKVNEEKFKCYDQLSIFMDSRDGSFQTVESLMEANCDLGHCFVRASKSEKVSCNMHEPHKKDLSQL